MKTTREKSDRPRQRSLRMRALRAAFLAAISFAACAASGRAQNGVVLVGSGSSVPAPLYSRWAQEFGKSNNGLQLRYITVGTSEGIKQISHGAGDFASGEAQLSDSERKEGRLIELPLVLIAIVPIYNLPELHQELRLSGEVLADIYLGEIKSWNAPQIAKLNPDANLPNMTIHVVNRPAGKGSNYVFTEFLSKVSPRFRSQVGATASPAWPVGVSAERSSDMADKVQSIPGAIGYVEYQYAVKNGIAQAAILNAAGRFIKASASTINAACQAGEAPQWNRFSASLTNASGPDSFPITSFSWLYLPLKSHDSARGAALSDLLNWMYGDGQHFASQEGYAELPSPLLAAIKRKVNELQ
jgi:phosphate transport system substrate-binding protein